MEPADPDGHRAADALARDGSGDDGRPPGTAAE
jgi:hypothetical protein